MKNWIPLSFIIACAVTMNCGTTATKDDTPKEVLAILHQVDSILEIPAIKDSILDPAEGGTNMIHYWLNSKSKELLYHAVSEAQTFSDANGTTIMIRYNVPANSTPDSLIREEFFYLPGGKLYYKRIDRKTHQVIGQGPFDEFTKSRGFPFYNYAEVSNLIQNLLTIDDIQGEWIKVEEQDEGTLHMKCRPNTCRFFKYEGDYKFVLVTGVNEPSFKITGIKQDGNDLVLTIPGMANMRIQRRQEGLVNFIYEGGDEELFVGESLKDQVIVDPCENSGQ